MSDSGTLSCSDWLTIDQPLITGFADAVSDHQFIHVDPARAAAETAWGGTIAHGFLILSLLTKLTRSALPEPAAGAVEINYGFDKVRFLAPVPSGSRIRGVFTPLSGEMKGTAELRRFAVSVEIEGASRPALIAEWLVLVQDGEKA